MRSSGMLRCLALVRADVSEEISPSIIRVTRIGEVRKMLAITRNGRTLSMNLVFLRCVRPLLVKANVVPSSPILVTRMMEVLRSPKRRFSQEPYGVTSQKTAFFTEDICYDKWRWESDRSGFKSGRENHIPTEIQISLDC
jgi:hypothetical protein